MPRVVATIVAWNSMAYLPDALASLKQQTHDDLSVIVVDNASSDGIAEFLRQVHPDVVLLRNAKNLGFAHGHNQAIAYAKTYLKKGEEELFILVTNPDVILEPTYVTTLVGRMALRLDAGSGGGKLLKAYRTGEEELIEQVRSDVLDSTGVRMTRSRRAFERGAGETDDEQHYGRTEEVFGVSGALAMYRLSALEDVAYRGEVFDEDFFAYKEDLDLAWRLRLRGWVSLYVPFAKAYHYRTAYGPERDGLFSLVRRRKTRSDVVRYHSYRNHFLLLLKNDSIRNTLLHLPFIAWYEGRKFLYILFFEPRTLVAVRDAAVLMPRMLAKRRLAMRRAVARPKEIRRWFR